MKMLRFRKGNQEQWGWMMGEDHVTPMRKLGEAPGGEVFPLREVEVLPPAEPSKIVCVGRNYADHIKEMGHSFGEDLPAEPGLFLKAPNTLVPSGAEVVYPDWTSELHYEGELAAVIGQTARNVSEEEALGYVLGYTNALDLTARDKQKSDLQWIRAKSADGFLPLGPVLETELDPNKTIVRTWVNDELRQEASTELMIFPLAQIISYVSRFMTLEPGDVILTGTPSGVGPLAHGDRVKVEVEGVGLPLEIEIS
ncbi:fumarylacetoacetate hydrolase family protein [Oceanithermus sp.]